MQTYIKKEIQTNFFFFPSHPMHEINLRNKNKINNKNERGIPASSCWLEEEEKVLLEAGVPREAPPRKAERSPDLTNAVAISDSLFLFQCKWPCR